MPQLKSKFVVAILAAAVGSISLQRLHGDVPPSSQPLATTAPVAVASGNVDQLIKQLGSDNPDDRDAAQKQLVEMGKPITAALKKAAENDEDPEIRSRASAALAQLKDHDDNDASLITLHNKDAIAQDVLNAIGAQAHAQFVGLGTTGLAPNVAVRTITVDVDNKPFWHVMTDVCTQLNVCPMLDSPGRNTMRLYPIAKNWISQSPHQIVGAYWIGVAGVYRARSIDLMGPPTTDDQFSLRMIVYPEPKLAVTQLSELKLKEATDDAGNSLMPKPLPAGMVSAFRAGRQFSHMIDVRLAYPDQPGKKISLIRGEVTAMLAQDVQKYQVDDVLGTPKPGTPLPHCTVKTTVLKQGTDMYRLTLECTRDGLSDDKWSAMLNRMGDITLEDADGHALTAWSVMPPIPTNDNTFVGNCIFSRSPMGINVINRVGVGGGVVAQPATKTGEPTKLIWSVATSVKPVAIPVELKDLPMP